MGTKRDVLTVTPLQSQVSRLESGPTRRESSPIIHRSHLRIVTSERDLLRRESCRDDPEYVRRYRHLGAAEKLSRTITGAMRDPTRHGPGYSITRSRQARSPCSMSLCLASGGKSDHASIRARIPLHRVKFSLRWDTSRTLLQVSAASIVAASWCSCELVCRYPQRRTTIEILETQSHRARPMLVGRPRSHARPLNNPRESTAVLRGIPGMGTATDRNHVGRADRRRHIHALRSKAVLVTATPDSGPREVVNA